jgi:hypothetical protein
MKDICFFLKPIANFSFTNIQLTLVTCSAKAFRFDDILKEGIAYPK